MTSSLPLRMPDPPTLTHRHDAACQLLLFAPGVSWREISELMDMEETTKACCAMQQHPVDAGKRPEIRMVLLIR